jgi:peptidyl-prolyl cis-trans isomerase SurA
MQEKQAVPTGIDAVILSSSRNTLMGAEGAAKSGAGFGAESVISSKSNSKTSSMAAALMVGLALSSAAGCNRGHSADVMATVNSHAIMKADLDKGYAAQLGDAQQQQQQPTHEQAESLRLNVLRELIDEEIVQQRAAKMNLTATNEEVDAKLAEMKAPYTEEQFDQRLKANNHTLDDVKHDLRRSLTFEKLLNKEINSKITVTDTDVKNYFNQHKSEFNLIETQYHLAQILVTSVPSQQPGNLQGSKATTDDEAKKKIQALKNRLDSGEDFGSIAMNFSERPETASNGGDMGFVAESQLHADPNVFAAVMKLKTGGITEILPLLDGQSKRPVGYAIYKLISREPAGQRDVNDPRVQQAIRQQLRDGRSQLLKNAFIEMLRDEAKVENFLAEEIFKNNAH